MGRLCTLGRWYLTFLGFRVSLPRQSHYHCLDVDALGHAPSSQGILLQQLVASELRGGPCQALWERKVNRNQGQLRGGCSSLPASFPFSALPLGFSLPHSPPAVLTGCLYEPTLWAGGPSGPSLHPHKTFPRGSLLSSCLHALPKRPQFSHHPKPTPRGLPANFCIFPRSRLALSIQCA